MIRKKTTFIFNFFHRRDNSKSILILDKIILRAYNKELKGKTQFILCLNDEIRTESVTSVIVLLVKNLILWTLLTYFIICERNLLGRECDISFQKETPKLTN